MSKAFEIKCKGRLGPEARDRKELRVLNRVLRITPEGLSYEADPRHAEHLIKALGLSECRFVSTPGAKLLMDAPPCEEPDSEVADIVASMSQLNRTSRITFAANPEVIEIKPYNEVDGIDPKKSVIKAGSQGVLSFQKISRHQDIFTGIDKDKMTTRRSERKVDGRMRRDILERALMDGAAWEVPTVELVQAVSKKNKYAQKRMGAKKVKSAERLLDSAENLTGDAATTYRALSARLNYLASDCPNLAFTAK